METRVEPPAFLGPDELARLYSVEEFEPLARERMADAGYRYVAGWAGTGETVRLNREAFGRWLLRPRALVDVTTIDPWTTEQSPRISLPLTCRASATAWPTRTASCRSRGVDQGHTAVILSTTRASIKGGRRSPEIVVPAVLADGS
jgi:isopentenyl diphosphate isomerase/L-lactate dehydrogenase-like FMN-dependent dehydrogenase